MKKYRTHTVEQYPALHIRKVVNLQLRMGPTTSLIFRRGEERIGSIAVKSLNGDGIVLEYKYAQSEQIKQPVTIVSSPCEFGGSRRWFLCPGCGRRAAVLYCRRFFRCRVCLGLSYASQGQRAFERGVRQTSARRRKLGGSGSLLESFPPKPKWMRLKTYLRLQEEDARETMQHLAASLVTLDKAATRLRSKV